MYFPELTRGRGGERKIQTEVEMEERQKADANKIIKCGKSTGMLESISAVLSGSRGKGNESTDFL